MKQTRLAGILELVRKPDGVVADLRIDGVSLIAIWPATRWNSSIRLSWECAAKSIAGEVRGVPGLAVRNGDTLSEDWDGYSTEDAEWAMLEVDERDIIPRLALLEGERVTFSLDYEPEPHLGHAAPKEDYEDAVRHIGRWAACRAIGYADSGPMSRNGPGKVSARRAEGLYPTGIFRWSGVKYSWASNGYEPREEPFAEVRWGASKRAAITARNKWAEKLAEEGRQAKAEYEEILRTKNKVAFQDAGGSPYIGVITSGRYGEQGVTVAWEWHWSPVPPMDNPVVDPGTLWLLATEPTRQQFDALEALAKKTSDSVLARTEEEAKTKEWVRAGAWPFWTARNLEAALEEIGLKLLELPICYGTQAAEFIERETT